MAVKQAGADFAQEQKQFNEALKSGDFRRVYLLCGEQAYLRLQNRDKLVKTLMDDGDAMNLSRYSGSDVTALELIDMAQTLPFFADRRVIVLENTGLLNPKTASKSVTGRGTASSIADEADKIAAFIKCVREKRAGNNEFDLAMTTTKETIDKIDLPEVKIFMDEFIPPFGLTLDELNS